MHHVAGIGAGGQRHFLWPVPIRFVGSFAIVHPGFKKWLEDNTTGEIRYLWRDNLMGLDISSSDPGDIALCRLRWEGCDDYP